MIEGETVGKHRRGKVLLPSRWDRLYRGFPFHPRKNRKHLNINHEPKIPPLAGDKRGWKTNF